jgi:cobalt-zinc-cadmium efflux system protein
MPHDHAHPAPKDLGPAFRWAVGLNTAYVIVEASAGFLTGSLALLADAAHNLTDVAGGPASGAGGTLRAA